MKNYLATVKTDRQTLKKYSTFTTEKKAAWDLAYAKRQEKLLSEDATARYHS